MSCTAAGDARLNGDTFDMRYTIPLVLADVTAERFVLRARAAT
jgi:hypothetical protein